MNLDFVYLGKATFLGVVAGLLSGAFGIGGGMVATPMTRMWLQLDPYKAIGTALVLVAPTAISGAMRYVKEGIYSKFLSRACLVPAIIGTVIGSFVCRYLNGHVLMMVVALLIAMSGLDFATGIVGLVLGKFKKQEAKLASLAPVGKLTYVASVVGLTTGFLSGLVGIGGGFILVPAFVYIFRVPIKEAIGTSLLTVAAVAVPGAIVHAIHDHVNLGVASAMIVGSIPGARIGASISLRLKDSVIKRAFGVLLLVVSIVFALKEIHSLFTSG
ncbi:MAG: sulfite exporter TauE/SafE family protein [Candidatus Obscuribacterales bacterium]|nr:sulfite exporter TauE/SafE family protein [Candidatus Obscuribacterales bacterium]